MASTPGERFALSNAWRKEPAPVSAVVVTVKVAPHNRPAPYNHQHAIGTRRARGKRLPHLRHIISGCGQRGGWGPQSDRARHPNKEELRRATRSRRNGETGISL